MANPADRQPGDGDETPIVPAPGAGSSPDGAVPATTDGVGEEGIVAGAEAATGAEGGDVEAGRDQTAQALDVVSDIDYSGMLDRLAECETPQQLFEKIHEEINGSLRTDQRIKAELGGVEGKFENILVAVCSNDFDLLTEIDRNSEEYISALRLTAIKNAMVAELSRLALDAYGEQLGITEMEKVTILGLQRIVPHVDNIYIKWRQNLFPDSLRNNKEFKQDPEEYLINNGLDDPYAVVRDNDGGDYEAVPCHVAFAGDYERLIRTIRHVARDIEKVPISTPEEIRKRAALVEYLATYILALESPVETTEEGWSGDKKSKWLSQKRWKDVDEAWLRCRERIQFIHGIEDGSDSELDPSETKIFPEFKIAIQHTDPETDRLLAAMRRENAAVLETLLRAKFGGSTTGNLGGTLGIISRSHVGLISVVSGGGNSMDALGCAQLAPNYEDVRKEHGAKAYVSAPDILEGRPVTDAVLREIFGDEMAADLDVKSGPNADAKWRNYIANYVGGHELGHLFIGEIEGFEETKATWVGLIGIHEREKNGSLPEGTAKSMMKAHVGDCLKALSNAVKSNGNSSVSNDPLVVARETLKTKGIKGFGDYDKEAVINARIFLSTGLISLGTDGRYVFNADKIEETYERIEETFLEFVRIKTTTESDEVLEEWVDQLVRGKTQKLSKPLADLRTLAVAGKLRHLRNSKQTGEDPPEESDGETGGIGDKLG